MIINSDNPYILIAIQSISDELLLRIKPSKLVKYYNQSNQLYNSEDRYIPNQLLLGEEMVGFIDDFNSRVIYYFKTNKQSLTLNFRSLKGYGLIEIFKENENLIAPSNQLFGKNLLRIENNKSAEGSTLHEEFLTYSNGEINTYYITFSTKFNIVTLPFIFKFNIFNDDGVILFDVNKDISLNIPVGKNILGYFSIDSSYNQLYFSLKRTKYIKSKTMSFELQKGNNWDPINVFMNYVIVKSNSYSDEEINFPTLTNHDINCHYNSITNSILEVIPIHSKFKSEGKLIVTINLANNDDEDFNLSLNLTPKVSNNLAQTVSPFTYFKNTVQAGGEIILKLPYIASIKDQNLNEEMFDIKKFVIELSTCDGDIEVSVYKTSYFNEDKSIKKIVTIENSFISIESNSDIYIKIKLIKGSKKISNDKKVSEWVTFTLIYQVFNDKNHIEDEFNDQGTITYGFSNNKVNIHWKGLKLYDNIKNSYFNEENVTYFIFSVKDRNQYKKMRSTCYLTELNPTYFTKERLNDLTNMAQINYLNSLQNYNKTIDYNLDHNGIGIINSEIINKNDANDQDHSLIIELEYNNVIYVNVLAISKSGLSFSYSPIEIFIPSANYNGLYTIIAITFFTVIILICLRSYYRKYKIAKLALKMELNSSINSYINDGNDSNLNQSNSSDQDLNVEKLDSIIDNKMKKQTSLNENILDEYSNNDIDRARNMVEQMSNEIIIKTKGYSDLKEE